MSNYSKTLNSKSEFKVGRQKPNFANLPQWKWMGNFTTLEKMSYGQIRSVKKVCIQHKGTWYGYSWSYWVDQCDKILKQEELRSAMIKTVQFLGKFATAQSDTEVLLKLS